MKLPIPDLIVFIVLTFGNVSLGVSFFFRNKTSDQFTSGGGLGHILAYNYLEICFRAWARITSICCNFDAVLSLILCALFIIWTSLSSIVSSSENLWTFKSPFHCNLTIIFGTLIIFIVGFLSTKLFPGKSVTK